MKQYWINQNGEQSGPLTIDQLRAMNVSTKAYVWHSGLDDWVKIAEVPELAQMFSGTEPVEGEKAEDAVAGTPLPPPELPANMPPVPPAAPVMPAAVDTTQPATRPECPPHNLVWAIISTILCCLPAGVVAIFYSVKVMTKYNEGDYAAAEHYSEVSAWWCIGTIILGIILQPFVMLLF